MRESGDLDGWLDLFLDGVAVQATDAVRYRAAVQSLTRGAANQMVDLAFERPVLTARTVEVRLGVSRPAVLTALRHLASSAILTEVREGPRGQLRWRADEIIKILTEEALP